jgi:hypothetical protein
LSRKLAPLERNTGAFFLGMGRALAVRDIFIEASKIFDPAAWGGPVAGAE